ncbi:hypothetical protein D3C80_1285230 [compost metagenome]
MRYLADALQAGQQRHAQHAVEMDDRDQRGNGQQGATEQQQLANARLAKLGQQRERQQEKHDVEQALGLTPRVFCGRPDQAQRAPRQQQQHTPPQGRLTPPGLHQHLPGRPCQDQRRQPQEQHQALLINLVARCQGNRCQEPDQP